MTRRGRPRKKKKKIYSIDELEENEKMIFDLIRDLKQNVNNIEYLSVKHNEGEYYVKVDNGNSVIEITADKLSIYNELNNLYQVLNEH